VAAQQADVWLYLEVIDLKAPETPVGTIMTFSSTSTRPIRYCSAWAGSMPCAFWRYRGPCAPAAAGVTCAAEAMCAPGCACLRTCLSQHHTHMQHATVRPRSRRAQVQVRVRMPVGTRSIPLVEQAAALELDGTDTNTGAGE
jgi:hypothetical protein